MKKIVQLLFYVLSVFTSYSQESLKLSGGYFGGGCDLDYRFCGNWFLNKDHRFVYIGYSTRDSVINTLGMGTWQGINKDEIKFKFNDSLNYIPISASIIYKAENRFSPDSAYYSGTFIYNSKGRSSCQDSFLCINGYIDADHKRRFWAKNDSFYRVFPIKDQLKKITKFHFFTIYGDTIPQPDFDVDYSFGLNFNYHHLNIIVNDQTKNIIRFSENDSVTRRIKRNISKTERGWISKLSESLIPENNQDLMIKQLQRALIKQPLYSTYLKKYLKILQN